MADINSGLYSMPPLMLSQDVSQSYWPWSGQIANSTTNPLPTTPQDAESEAVPVFSASTSELDRYRVLFLILGIVIGAMLLGKK